MGPWDHAGTRTPTQEVGGLKFGPACLIDLNKLHREWYDWTMKGGDKPKFLEKRVAYYVAGAEAWKYADSLEAIPAKAREALPRKARTARRWTRSTPERSAARSQVDHPQPPTCTIDSTFARRSWSVSRSNLADQRLALNLFGNGLVFHSEPFPEAVEIAGYLKLVASIALDVPDTDFAVKV